MSITRRDSSVIWHPYTSMKATPDSIGIVRGEGAYLIDEEGNRYLDAIASWWVNLHGHAHPYIAQKVSEQLGILEHCIFAGFTHEPAVLLAEKLLGVLPSGMQKIFYSDNGSTAVEVAIKMALQYWSNKGIKRNRLVALEGAYHGDTFGAMSVSSRSIFTEAFIDQLFEVSFIPFPDVDHEADSISSLEKQLKNENVAAFIVEPLVQGAGGMNMYSAKILEQYFKLCKQYDVLVIADEVMTGFGRTGPLFACDHIELPPDIVCLSKGLTGGTMPMGVTATTRRVFDAFYDDDKMKMLYHGHSFTANPVACAASLASFDLLVNESCEQNRMRIAAAHEAFIKEIADNSIVANVRYLGTILAINLQAPSSSYHHSLRDVVYRFFIERKIIMRPLGNIIYILPPYCITNSELQYIYEAIKDLLVHLQTLKTIN